MVQRRVFQGLASSATTRPAHGLGEARLRESRLRTPRRLRTGLHGHAASDTSSETPTLDPLAQRAAFHVARRTDGRIRVGCAISPLRMRHIAARRTACQHVQILCGRLSCRVLQVCSRNLLSRATPTGVACDFRALRIATGASMAHRRPARTP